MPSIAPVPATRRLIPILAVSASLLALIAVPVGAAAQQVIEDETVRVPGDQPSPWTISGDLTVADFGSASLIVEGGGVVTSTSGHIGRDFGASGAVTVTGPGSSWDYGGELRVGNYGDGWLTLEDGGSASGTIALIGAHGGSTGMATVGAGSHWNNSTGLYIADWGVGTLTIRDGGSVSSANGYIGSNAGANGLATVTGVNSEWLNSYLFVGSSGAGTLVVENGGAVSANEGFIGLAPGSLGVVRVGAGGTLSAPNGQTVGYSGTGALLIEGGGSVTNGNAFVGHQAGSAGAVRLAGGSSWDTNGGAFIGNFGEGTVAVEGGSLFHSGYSFVGSNAGSQGAATVSGAGSIWINDGGLFIGNVGTGSLTIADGGLVRTGGGFGIVEVGMAGGAIGTVTIGGAGPAAAGAGTLEAGEVRLGGGGTIRFNHDAPAYVFAPLITGSGALEHYAGTTILTANHSYAGGTIIHGGTLQLGNGGTAGWFGGGDIGNNGTLAFNRADDIGFAWAISGTGGVSQRSNATLTLSGANSYTGTTHVGSGVMKADVANVFGIGSALAVDAGAVLDLNGLDQSFGSISGGGTIRNLLGAVTLTTGADGRSTLFSGTIDAPAATVNLTKIGAGTLTLSGANAYDGETLVRGGTLLIEGNSDQGANAYLIGRDDGDTGALTISAGGELKSGSSQIGVGAGALGAASVDGSGSAWTVAGSLLVGGSGSGALTIGNDGTLTTASASIARQAGSAGSAMITGGGSLWTVGNLIVGEGGSGALSVSAGGTLVTASTLVGAATGSSGLAAVTGAGSVWIDNGGTLSVGQGGGNGALTLADGGSLQILSGPRRIAIAATSGSTGALNIGAAPGEIPAAAPGAIDALEILLGPGSATLNFNHDATGYILALPIIGTGTVDHYAGVTILRGANLYTGDTNVRGGTLILEGSGDQGAGAYRIGRDTGDNGAFAIASGGTLTSQMGMIGDAAGANGTVLIGGPGSRWTVDTLAIGRAGIGAVTVDTGGRLATAASAVLGVEAGGTGSALVTGAGARWDVGTLAIGQSGAGTFTIAGGGEVTSIETGIATLAGSTGQAVVTGASARWINVAGLTVGAGGNGSLLISNGGSVANPSGLIGEAATASGSATVEGAGSLWLSDDLKVGGNGTGQLIIRDGGSVESQTAILASGAGGTGSAAVTGAGSRWTAADSLVIGGAGNGSLTLSSGGKAAVASGLTLLAANAGAAGTLNIGAAAGQAAASAGILDSAGLSFGDGSGTLVFNHNDAGYDFTSRITGTGVIDHRAGDTILSADNSYNGATIVRGGTLTLAGANSGSGPATVTGGTLLVDGSTASATTVQAGAMLGGAGRIDAAVRIENGGVLRGVQGQVLTLGTLELDGGAITAVTLGAADGADALFAIGGDLALNGVLDIADIGGFGPGIYALFTYGGQLTGNGLTFGASPAGVADGDLFIQTRLPNQVNLVSTSGVSLLIWDGGDTALHDNGAIDGGSGVWTASARAWTSADGALNNAMSPRPGFAVFQGRSGIVTADGSLGAIGVSGMQFASDGYSLAGAPVALQGDGGVTVIRVGNGSGAGAGVTARIAAELTGSSVLAKTDLGTLILTGRNSYTGGTTVSAGVLQIGDGGVTGSIGGDIVNNGIVRFNRSDSIVFSGGQSGAGRLIQQGSGILTLTGDNVQTGGVVIAAGTLQVGDGGASGSIAGPVVNDGTLAFNRADTLAFGGNISGSGALLQTGTGTLILLGDAAHEGGTTISAGTLQIGNGGTLGTLAGDVRVDGSLVFNRADALLFGGAISGGGRLAVAAGNITLSGNGGAFGGVTDVTGGTLTVTGLLGSGQSRLDVLSGGLLTGTGGIGGAVAIGDGGTLSGTTGSQLTLASLALSPGATINAALGAPGGTSALFNVAGDLALNGNLAISDKGGFGPGVYRLFDYGGSLTGTGLAIAAAPSGTADLAIQTGIAAQVNLVNAHGQTLAFWDGSAPARWNDGAVEGGSGTWRLGLDSWTNADGRINGPAKPSPAFAIFQGKPGDIAVDGSAGGIAVTGLQFASDGYAIRGDAITLSGQTAILRVGDGSASGAAYAATIAADLTGPAALLKSDLGTLRLTGVNTYAGGTVVEAGTLIGNSASLSGNIRNDARLVFDQGFDASFAGTIAGTGQVVKEGAGILRLTGASSANWHIKAGGLVSTSALFTGDLAIDEGASFRFDQNWNGQYAGRITGDGSLLFSGGGKVLLTGDSAAYRGLTTVAADTIRINGQLGGMLSLLAGARLEGSGTIGSARVAGIVAPGNSIGTLHIDGDLTLSATAALEIEVNPAGESDRLVVTGKALIEGGSILALASGGDYAPFTDYQILSAAGGITGAFDTVRSSLAFLDPLLSYTADTVTLRLVRNQVRFEEIAKSRNQRAAAPALEALGHGNAVYDALLLLDPGDARRGFDQLSGEGHATLRASLIDDSRLVRDALLDRDSSHAGAWGRLLGSWSETAGDGNARGFVRDLDGLMTGISLGAGAPWNAGISFGYSDNDLRGDGGFTARTESYHAGLDAAAHYGALSLRLGAARSWHDIKATRMIAFPGFSETASSERRAHSDQVFAELDWRPDSAPLGLAPFAGFAHVRLRDSAFAEAGEAAALRVGKGNFRVSWASLGARASGSVSLNGLAVTFGGSAAVRYALGDLAPVADAAFADGAGFTVAGAPLDRVSAMLKADAEIALAPALRLGLGYSGAAGRRSVDRGINATLSWNF